MSQFSDGDIAIHRIVASFTVTLEADDLPLAVTGYQSFEDLLLERACAVEVTPEVEARRVVEWRIARCDPEAQTVTFSLVVDFE